LQPLKPLPPHCWYFAETQPPADAAGVTDVAIVLGPAAFVAEGVGCAGAPPVAVTTEPALPAIASVPPEITAGPGAM